MSGLPLIAGFAPDAVFAWRDGVAIRTSRYLGDVARLAALLPDHGQVLNLCADRYRFAVGFGAALLRGQVSLLPPNHTPVMVAQLAREYPGLYCLREAGGPALEIETLLFPDEAGGALVRDLAPDPEQQVPLIPAQQVAALVFTSGSTGTPLPNRKTWGLLTQSAQAEAARLGLGTAASERASWSLVGTVPPQHMYGFESTVLLPLQGGLAMHAGRPFYAADVAAALAALPRPRALITTPVHLRALVEEAAASPSFHALPDFLLCATAPLSDELAHAAEQSLKAPLYEIYGCTEAGQVATRRSTAGPRWQALPGLQLRQDQQGTWVRGGHVEGEVLLGDIIELDDFTHFELRGRNADMINIAGKRTSLAHLNFQLGSIEGVRDGVFVMPEGEAEKNSEVMRLAALVVAPGMSSAQISAALRRRIDAVFLPRPLYMVDALPRNSTGKLTAAVLRELLAQCASNHGAT